MQKNNALSIFCIFCVLFNCYMQNMQNMTRAYSAYCSACSFAYLCIVSYVFCSFSCIFLHIIFIFCIHSMQNIVRFVHLPDVSRGINAISAKLPDSGTRIPAQSTRSISEHQSDSSGWYHCSGTRALLSRPVSCNPSFPSHSEILQSSLQQVLGLDFVKLDGPSFV